MMRRLPAPSLSTAVDATPGNAAEQSEGASMLIAWNLVALRRVGRDYEGGVYTELRAREQDLAMKAADHQRLLAPVTLEGLAEFELERDEA